MPKCGINHCGRRMTACTDGTLEFERMGSVAFCIVSILCAIRSSGLYRRLKILWFPTGRNPWLVYVARDEPRFDLWGPQHPLRYEPRISILLNATSSPHDAKLSCGVLLLTTVLIQFLTADGLVHFRLSYHNGQGQRQGGEMRLHVLAPRDSSN